MVFGMNLGPIEQPGIGTKYTCTKWNLQCQAVQKAMFIKEGPPYDCRLHEQPTGIDVQNVLLERSMVLVNASAY